MFRLAICDDNNDFIQYECKIINAYFEKMNEELKISTYNSGYLLLSDEKISEYDLILLDYDMEGINGFETAKKLRELTQTVNLAFVTVHYDFSREGYRFDALRYLVKQESTFEDELIDCINKAIKLQSTKTINTTKAYKFVDGTKTVDTNCIVFIVSSKHYLDFYIDTGSKVVKEKLRSPLDKIVPDLHNFAKIRQSTIVNFKYVTSISNDFISVGTNSGYSNKLQIADSRVDSVLSSYLEYMETGNVFTI